MHPCFELFSVERRVLITEFLHCPQNGKKMTLIGRRNERQLELQVGLEEEKQ